MKKNYTVLSVTHTKISEEKGSMIWTLLDRDVGSERKINAVTTLDAMGYIETVRPIYVRETPLVDRLMNQVEGDNFSIDFGPFNEAMGYVKREVYEDIKKLEQASKLSQRVNRILMVVTILIICWLVWLSIESFTDFANLSANHHELP